MSANAATATPSQTNKPSLTLKRRIAASPQKVFAAWTTPDLMARWFGPGPIEVTKAECDLRVGGRYRIVMQAPDGEVHDLSGIYREVTAGSKLVFTFAWITMPERESLVTVSFKPDGDGTLLTLTHELFIDETARDLHQQGWTGCLEKLEAVAASA